MNIDPKLQNTLAFQIAERLDAKDGTKDGKISASVWNEFVNGKVVMDKNGGTKQGNTINSYITLEKALKSITTYAVSESAQSGKTSRKEIDDLAKTWLDKEPPIEGSTKLGSTPEKGQIVQSETLDFTINKNEDANLPIKDTKFVDEHKQAGKQVADELKTQLQHDWSPKAAKEVLGKINKDNVAYVVQAYGENLAKDIDNVFGLDEEDVVKSVIKPLFEKYTELGFVLGADGNEVTSKNFEEFFKGRSLDELKKDLKLMSEAVINKEQSMLEEAQAHNKKVNAAKKFNEDIPKMQEQIQGANKLLAEIANMNPKPEIKETVKDGKRWRRIGLPDGRWVRIYYKNNGNIDFAAISNDTTPNHRQDGSTFDGDDVRFYDNGTVRIDTDHSNDEYDYRLDNNDNTKILKFVEKIFGKMEPIQE